VWITPLFPPPTKGYQLEEENLPSKLWRLSIPGKGFDKSSWREGGLGVLPQNAVLYASDSPLSPSSRREGGVERDKLVYSKGREVYRSLAGAAKLLVLPR